MSDVIDFPGRRGSGAGRGPSSRGPTEPQFDPLDCDVLYVAEALMQWLPPAALRHAAFPDLKAAAARAVRDIDEARRQRAADPDYDRRRRGESGIGEIDALAEMIRGSSPDDAPVPPDPPECA